LTGLTTPCARRASTPSARRRLVEEIDTLWRTGQLRTTQVQPLDEVRSVMAVFDETLYLVVPEVYRALSPKFPGLKGVSLHDYKVRILDGGAGTGATTRVLIESGRGLKRWTTVGCSSNIIEASLAALVDSFEYAQFTRSTGRP